MPASITANSLSRRGLMIDDRATSAPAGPQSRARLDHDRQPSADALTSATA
jgi:hypothetical protein